MSADPSNVVVPLTGETRVLIIDSHAIVREGLSVLLALEADLDVVGHAATVQECLDRAPPPSPDLIIFEPGPSGPTAVEHVRRVFPASLVLVLSVLDGEETIRTTLNAGAHGYVLKESGRQELLAAVRSIIGGGRYLCSRAAARVVSSYLGDASSGPAPVASMPITRSEREILAMVAKGLSNKHIARVRQRSVRTIEKQRAMLMRKLGLHNAADVTRFALERGILGLESAANPAVALAD